MHSLKFWTYLLCISFLFRTLLWCFSLSPFVFLSWYPYWQQFMKVTSFFRKYAQFLQNYWSTLRYKRPGGDLLHFDRRGGPNGACPDSNNQLTHQCALSKGYCCSRPYTIVKNFLHRAVIKQRGALKKKTCSKNRRENETRLYVPVLDYNQQCGNILPSRQRLDRLIIFCYATLTNRI